jgi:hypothetical protein
LNQRVVFEIVLLNETGCGLFLARSRRWAASTGFAALFWSPMKHFLRPDTVRRAFRLDKFNLRVGMADLRELGLQQGVVARIVNQRKMIREFRIKADDQGTLFSNETGPASSK